MKPLKIGELVAATPIVQGGMGVVFRCRVWHLLLQNRVAHGECKPKQCPFNCIKTCNVVDSPYCIMLALYNAYKGRMEHGYAFCGANAWRCNEIVSVKELMEQLRLEYDKCV